MQRNPFHLTEPELLQSLDGELSAERAHRVEEHLAACWSCRERVRTLEESISSVIRAQRAELGPHLPPADGPRALLKAHLAERVATETARPTWPLSQTLAVAAIALIVIALAALASYEARRLRTSSYEATIYSAPKPNLTPGAVVLRSRDEVCSAKLGNNQVVPVSMRRRVFNEYGISDADARAYEVDYLITPALGGSDDIRNLWPQSYSATVWNAHVKDALEDRLRGLVCDGSLDLAVAQRDLSQDWIAAYQKYFHTDRPLEIDP
jgi:hypothetical protein